VEARMERNMYRMVNTRAPGFFILLGPGYYRKNSVYL
jgi:hypothetical protein